MTQAPGFYYGKWHFYLINTQVHILREELHPLVYYFELKYFFSSHVNTDSGGECSSTAIRALIKKMVATENSIKPLSDNKIATLLADQGIQVARRTIAKYRESLGISPSHQRKSLI